VKGHGEKFSRRKEQAIAALLTVPTAGEAAKTVGISSVTLWRWMQDPDFRDRYAAARRQVVQEALATIQTISKEAAGVLRTIMNNSNSPAAVRVAAAKIIIDMALRIVEIDELLVRIEKLEMDAGRIEVSSWT